jgi:hypothetical protein
MIRNAAFSFILWATLSAGASDVAGTWKTTMVDPPPGSPLRPKAGYEPSFEFRISGDKLDGQALIKKYPGNAPILDGRIQGDHFSFRVIHEQGREIPNVGIRHMSFRCDGIISAGHLDLTMVPIKEDGSDDSVNRTYKLRATRDQP